MNLFIKMIFLTKVCILCSVLASADVITIVSDIWCPYNCEPNSNLPGYAIETTKKIFEKSGHKIQYEINPWSRAIILVRIGKSISIIGATKNETPDFIFPDEEIGISMTHFFVKKESKWQYTGINSLKNIKVGVQGEYEYGVLLDDYFLKHKDTEKVQFIRSEEPLKLNIRKLIVGRVDVIVEDKFVFTNLASYMKVNSKVKVAGLYPIENKKEFNSAKLYLAFSPKHPKSKEYAAILSAGIKNLRASGELKRIMQKYKLMDWREVYADLYQKFENK